MNGHEYIQAPPHSIPAEQGVLGGLLVAGGKWDEISGLVSAGDFYREDHQRIFRAMAAVAGEGNPVDIITVSERMEADGTLDGVGGLQVLGALTKDTVSVANIAHHAELIRKAAQKRELKRVLLAAAETLDSKSGDLHEAIGNLQSSIDALMRRETGGYSSLDDAIRSGLETIEIAAEAREKKGVAGVPTGLPALDRFVGGLQPPRLIVLAARPSIGKTALANQIALNALSRGIGVGMCSLEMGLDEIAIRSIAHRCQLNGSALAYGDDAEVGMLFDALKTANLSGLPYWLDEHTYTLGGIVARISEWKRKRQIGLAIVDHLGLVEVDGASNANDRLGKISRTLKILAKRLHIPILAVSQLNRNVEREKRRPFLADLRDSGSIEQDADIAVFLHSPDEEGREMEIGILKNRGGRKGWMKTRFEFYGDTQTFREIASEY